MRGLLPAWGVGPPMACAAPSGHLTQSQFGYLNIISVSTSGLGAFQYVDATMATTDEGSAASLGGSPPLACAAPIRLSIQSKRRHLDIISSILAGLGTCQHPGTTIATTDEGSLASMGAWPPMTCAAPNRNFT